MKVCSVYRLADGGLVGRTIIGPEESIQANLQPGEAVVDGEHDHLCCRVDLETGEVVSWQPPEPASDEFRTWTWNAEVKRWLPVPTDAAIARDVRAERDRLLSECDWVVLRAVEHGRPQIDPSWAAYRQALRDITEQPGFPRTITWPTKPQ